MEDINFYKAKFGKEPPLKKLRPTPAVAEQYYGIDDLEKHKMEEHKMNLKRNIYDANQGNPMPPIYYILGSETDYDNSLQAVHNLPDILPVDDINLVYSHEQEVESEVIKNKDISPLKNHPPSLDDILRKAESILEMISVDDDKIAEIEEATRDQSNSSRWYAERCTRITASKCKRALMKETTSPTKAMQEILCYKKPFQSDYMKDGIKSEAKIINLYSKSTGNKVQQCGFFVSKSHPFLGASPDGLVGDDGTIELKKIHPHQGETLTNALVRLNIVKETDGILSINENHPYYYQVQQQQFCAGRKWTDFVASDGINSFVRRVEYNNDFWITNLPRLAHFYYNVLLLELAYPRVRDGLPRIGKLGTDFSTLSSLRKE